MPNRKIPPPIKEISKLQLPAIRSLKLDNGIPVHLVEMGTQEVLKLEIIFHAGRPYEQQKLVARATSRMLREGTQSFSSADIAEQIDFYGATLNLPINLDTSSITMYTLTKHLEALLPLLAEILSCPIFPEDELQTFVNQSMQSLQVELTKNEVVAYRTITELFFGKDHPYGYNSLPETYKALNREDLLQHFRSLFHSGNCQILISGYLQANSIELLNRYLGNAIPFGERSKPKIITDPMPIERLMIPHTDSVQTAIRIGRRLYSKHHPDYQGFYILNTVLGGYFGSRLMTNIREDKGYTYNIFSTIDSFHHDGCFYIGTEVGNEFKDATITEIYREMARLQEDLVPEGELEMLRNYLLGSLLSMVDGPFNVASIVKTIVVEDLSYKDFDDLVALIKNISPQKIRDLAQQYFNKEDMWEVIVGVE